MDARPGAAVVENQYARDASRSSDSLPEPPSKRLRIDGGQTHPTIWSSKAVLTECLKTQVFPHIEEHISRELPGLPDDVRKELGKQVVALVSGPEFSAEYKRGNGRISPQYEQHVSARALAEVRALARHHNLRVNTPGAVTHVPVPAPPARLSETPIHPPPLPAGIRLPSLPSPSVQQRRPAAPIRQSVEAPRFSHSPIPVPVIPNRKPAIPNGVARDQDGGRNHNPDVRANRFKNSPVVIVIDDDNDDDSKHLQLLPLKKPPTALPPNLSTPIKSEYPPEPHRIPPPANLPPVTPPRANVKGKLRGHVPTSPANFRSRAHAAVWRGQHDQAVDDGKAHTRSSWFPQGKQPYICSEMRRGIINGAHQFIRLNHGDLFQPVTFHVDFTLEEVRCLQVLTRQILGLPTEKKKKDLKKDLQRLLKKNTPHIERVLKAAVRENRLPRRSKSDIAHFFKDVMNQKTASEPMLLRLQRDDYDRQGDFVRSSRIHSLLFAREISGHRGYGSMRRPENFSNEFRKCREDSLELRSEWTDCAGDISTIVWVSDHSFICGTTEHSDSHNQQYNKPGNLVLGSSSLGTLRAYPDHRIVRPIVEKGENSTDAMIQSQDPWLYSSVVSSDYDSVHDRAFTSGFDRTVKVWRVEQSGSAMHLLGEWRHGGNVNFVATSRHESGMVATAADVAQDAVRIYDISENAVSGSPFRSYSCSRITDAEGNSVSTEKWAYFPATMQWGRHPAVRHMLLVGYSPRSRTNNELDIPEDRKDSGELCLWDGLTGERWKITSATTQNVFEVLWHPTQPWFIAATSPLGLEIEDGVRTQIRVFRETDNPDLGGKAYSPIKTLDCAALDINELTIMPNSLVFCYITAGCTDGNTYVWDTALGDKPIHVLRHGAPIEEYRGDRECEDVGVKFTAWGTTPDRFYTGSSDGVVKVWNVRSLRKPLVRDLLEVPGPVSCGMFSPDQSKLVIGDATGRVFLLSFDQDGQGAKQPSFMRVQPPGARTSRTVRRPMPVMQHKEPPAPAYDAAGRPIEPESGPLRAKTYLAQQYLRIHPNPTIGAVQGPKYAETGLFLPEAHLNNDPSQPLLARWEVTQQEAKGGHEARRDMFRKLRAVKEAPDLASLHSKNANLDLKWEGISDETKLELQREGVKEQYITNPDYALHYEESSSDEF
ncbi:WD40-repeat-containing domain protein [Podospora didyma]|uniref:WD40-repeat-containing domain protein n=1 Tax=Podospora didyma TaxID=330526 RepID=A0AAE0U1B4_9PEZI|nr:WD40-repeat-containing domain protein [Podospora didyma]